MSANDARASAPRRSRRPGLRSLAVLVLSEAKMVVRDTAGLIVPLGLPLLILLTSAGSSGEQVITAGRTALDLFVLPLVITMVLTMVGVLNMPSFLAYYRRSGILRRLALTPASPVTVMAAQVIVSILQSVLGITLALVVALTVFGARPPVDLLPALGVLALAAAAMYAMGMIVAATAPTPNSAVAIGLIGFLLLGATGGMFGGLQSLPEPIARIGGHLPFGATVEALGAAWAGQPVGAAPLLSLVAAIVVGVTIASWLFRWE
ncbi:ABC transporter permease [Brachybacterium sacelli]|uniref:ABC-2 type transport system permease protein n=1 Tax=Brachybacterium sacelli TaxID=173364 RepID=A0ABS4X0Q9_9MICO|nr:ABC transporter permease [Brachybacterium sacelli]MBP2382057.1 ABC-2 type transport system permease protein [Brachybacterium sacelli]